LRILLTGAEGFTGRQFTRSAAAAGHQVEPLRSDLTDAEAVRQEVAGLDVQAVVHLAAIAFVAHRDDRALYDVNLFGTLNLLNGLKHARRPLHKILLASSANIYGNCPQSPIAETQPPAPVNHYAMSKLAMEHMSRAHGEGLPLVIVRPFNYTGRGQPLQFVIPKLVDHFRRRVRSIAMGNLQVEREYNDVRLVCEAYLRLLRDGREGEVYNICTGRPFGFSEVLELLEKLSGHHVAVNVDPALVRSNEVVRLCGDPSRLVQAVGPLPSYSLEDTLSWMLEEPAAC
jgi:GDP-6-deoxy-D-talose 4-dehydrogenase